MLFSHYEPIIRGSLTLFEELFKYKQGFEAAQAVIDKGRNHADRAVRHAISKLEEALEDISQ